MQICLIVCKSILRCEANVGGGRYKSFIQALAVWPGPKVFEEDVVGDFTIKGYRERCAL